MAKCKSKYLIEKAKHLGNTNISIKHVNKKANTGDKKKIHEK